MDWTWIYRKWTRTWAWQYIFPFIFVCMCDMLYLLFLSRVTLWKHSSWWPVIVMMMKTTNTDIIKVRGTGTNDQFELKVNLTHTLTNKLSIHEYNFISEWLSYYSFQVLSLELSQMASGFIRTMRPTLSVQSQQPSQIWMWIGWVLGVTAGGYFF